MQRGQRGYLTSNRDLRTSSDDGVERGIERGIGTYRLRRRIEDDPKQDVRAKVTLRNPARYPQFIRELAEAGIIDPCYLVSVNFKEES